ncbi:MAG: hypothetical protein M0021_09420 [Clostridia bacterium]|nr:hypothetical protein [Clostridia bacterium]
MLLIVFTKWQEKLAYALRILLILVFLSLLLPKALHLLVGSEFLGSYNKEENPSGNPTRVEHVEAESKEEPGLLDGIVIELQKFYRKDR